MAGTQTSKITTAAADDLTIQPAAGKKTLLKSVDSTNPGQTPLATATDGELKALKFSDLEDIGTLVEDDDLIIIQDVSDGNKVKKIRAGELGGGGGTLPQPPFGDPLPSNGLWLDEDSVLAVQAGGSGSSADLRNSVEFAVADATYNQTDKNVVQGQSVFIRWLASKLSSATHGQIISGTLYSKSGSSFSQTWNLTISKQPTGGWNLVDVADKPVSTEITSDLATPTGLNAPSPVTIDGGTLTGIEVSINGGAFTSSPGNIEDGQTIAVKGTTGASNETAYTALISIGGLQETWTATTAPAVATISQPTITTPISGATDLIPVVKLISTNYEALNGAGSHTATNWEVYEADINAAPPSSDPPGAGYTSITPSDTKKKRATLDASNLTETKTYYSRVRYTDGTVTSQWSPWHKFSTANVFKLNPGDPIGGGYFAGEYSETANNTVTHHLIVCPMTQGSLVGGIIEPGSFINYANDNGETFPEAQSLVYGGTGSKFYSGNPDYEAFYWNANLATGPNNGTFDVDNNSAGTGIGGNNDWYIPALHEMMVVYFFLKPNTDVNFPYSGLDANYEPNPNSVDPYTPNTHIGEDFPEVTTSDLFKSDGAETFVNQDTSGMTGGYWYHTSSDDDTFTNGSWWLSFVSGTQDRGDTFGHDKSDIARVRAIRRIPV